MIGSDSKIGGIFALKITKKHKLTPLFLPKIKNELFLIKTTKLTDQSGIDGLDNFLLLAK